MKDAFPKAHDNTNRKIMRKKTEASKAYHQLKKIAKESDQEMCSVSKEKL